MSMAVLIKPRRGSTTRAYHFTPGRMERLHLRVWRVEGALRARLTGQAYIACGMGNEHHPEVDIDVVGHPANADSADLKAAYNRDPDAALRVAEELEYHALDGWFDPCEAEGLEEE